MTLEEILKKRGYTDSDLAGIAPLLGDARFRSTLEETYGSLETEVGTLRGINEEWRTKTDSEYVPAIQRAESDAARARRELADAREQLAIAKDYGYTAPETPAPVPPNPNPAAPAFDPKAYNLLTTADANGFAQAQARAMAEYMDISAEHQGLFGKPIEKFSALYTEEFLPRMQRDPKTTIRGVWEQKYKVSDRRAELARQEQERHDAEISKQAVGKYISEHGGNPNMTTAMPSAQPFMAAPRDNKLPWAAGTDSQLKAARIERANKAQAGVSIQQGSDLNDAIR